VAAGVVSPIEEKRSEVLVATAQVAVDRARRALDARRLQLATHWGSTTAVFASATGDLEVLPDIPSLDALGMTLTRNPDLARWVSEVERRQAALTLAKAVRVPDVTLSAGYRRFTSIDSQAFVVGASIPLPLFDRNRDGIRAAEAAVDQANQAAQAAQLHLVARLADAYRLLASARDDVTTLRARVVPGARSVFDAVQEGYQLGRFGLMDELDAQRTLVSANGQYLQALTAYHQAVTAVERLVGQPLAEVAAGIK
jgi:cobalt-zinc-cadmium efflux system outer membrane protein